MKQSIRYTIPAVKTITHERNFDILIELEVQTGTFSAGVAKTTCWVDGHVTPEAALEALKGKIEEHEHLGTWQWFFGDKKVVE